MINLSEARNILLHCHADNLIDDDEFILLYDITELANPEFPYWAYPPFDLENFSDGECNAEFRFSNNIYRLVDALRIPNEVRCSDKQPIDVVMALCVLLKRNSYPCTPFFTKSTWIVIPLRAYLQKLHGARLNDQQK